MELWHHDNIYIFIRFLTIIIIIMIFTWPKPAWFEEVMIFCYRQTDRRFIIIYISSNMSSSPSSSLKLIFSWKRKNRGMNFILWKLVGPFYDTFSYLFLWIDGPPYPGLRIIGWLKWFNDSMKRWSGSNFLVRFPYSIPPASG